MTEWHVWSTAFIVAEWAIRLVMLAYVPYRRSPNAARAWLLLIFLEPVVGVVLYAIFGRAYLPRWRIERQRRSSAYLRARRDAAPSGLLAAGPTLEPKAWAPNAVRVAYVVFLIYYWLDALLVTNQAGRGSNPAFIICLQIIFLCLIFGIFASPATKNYYRRNL